MFIVVTIVLFGFACFIWAMIRKRIATTNLNNEFANAHKNDLHEIDPIYLRAVEIIKERNKVSICLIQLSLRIGYIRAAAIVEKMEKAGLISKPNEEGKREVLIK